MHISIFRRRQKRHSLKLASITLILAIFFSVQGFSRVLATSGAYDSALTAIKRAEDAVIKAYQAVYQAKQMGGNVTGLVDDLNLAIKILDQARTQYGQGNLDAASKFADLCYKDASKIASDASKMQSITLETGSRHLWVAAIESAAVSCIAVLASFALWRVFERRYKIKSGR